MKAKDEDIEASPFGQIDKSQILQEARIFNDNQLNVRKCTQLLTKILYLLYQGEVLGQVEATELFFAITKLFQSKDVMLRRLVYLAVKELSDKAQDVIMVTSSLQKDMNSKTEMTYRASAIRALCKVTDSSMVTFVERFIKQAIVDKTPHVASAALVSALHLYNDNKDVVKRWANEAQEALNSKAVTVQYHALGLLYQIRQKDRMAVAKLVQTAAKTGLRSALAQVMLIRYAVKVMEDEDSTNGPSRSLFDFLESCIRHKSEMVVLEAARAICSLPGVTSKELIPAVAVLQLFLSSTRPTYRFAAIRTLNRVAATHPVTVSPCNLDLENLITDPNRSISTLAITTLLKTGNETSVDRLIKQIEGFMSEISDEFKVVVVEATRALCLKFPSKQSTLLNFLASCLREEGGFEYKKALVDTLVHFVSMLPESRDFIMGHLGEFIEDCEHPSLTIEVLHMLGREAPQSASPTKYIRYINNRIVLEGEQVRAAAVSALAKFGLSLPSVRPSIVVLLRRCLHDPDDEVRDRAALSLDLLAVATEQPQAKPLISSNLAYNSIALERALATYLSDPSLHVRRFEALNVPLVPVEQELQPEQTKKEAAIAAAEVVEAPRGGAAAGAAAATPASEARQFALLAEQVARNPEFAKYGPLLKASKPVRLTEAETEYNITATKLLFARHIVFQFNCRNTLNDQLLENVYVAVETDSDELRKVYHSTIPRLAYDDDQTCYVAFQVEEGTCPSAAFTNTLKFIVKDCDPETQEADPEGYDDEYQLEDTELSMADYMLPTTVTSFKDVWDELGEDNQVVETFQLSALQTLAAAVESVTDFLGMRAAEKTEVAPTDKQTHVLLLAGMFLGRTRVLARCRMAVHPSSGVTMELTVRSEDADISALVASAIS